MSLSKPDTPFQIVPDLLHDARINYKPWLACIFAIAASQCQTQFDSGCLFMVMTDAEYAAFPLHVDAGGQAIQRPTVVPPVLPPIDANGMLRDGFNRALAHHEAWITVRATYWPRSLNLCCHKIRWLCAIPNMLFCSSPSPTFLLTSRRSMGR
jgi:hypothetical protein